METRSNREGYQYTVHEEIPSKVRFYLNTKHDLSVTFEPWIGTFWRLQFLWSNVLYIAKIRGSRELQKAPESPNETNWSCQPPGTKLRSKPLLAWHFSGQCPTEIHDVISLSCELSTGGFWVSNWKGEVIGVVQDTWAKITPTFCVHARLCPRKKKG